MIDIDKGALIWIGLNLGAVYLFDKLFNNNVSPWFVVFYAILFVIGWFDRTFVRPGREQRKTEILALKQRITDLEAEQHWNR